MRIAISSLARRVALLVDAENIGTSRWPAIREAASRYGNMALFTCFADFSNNGPAAWLEICRQYGGNAEMVLRSGDRKNGSDIALAIEAMDLVHSRAVDAIAVVSSDSDFAPLARKITQSGLLSIGIGLPLATTGLRCAFDHFIELEHVAAVVPAAPAIQAVPVAPTATPILTAKQRKALLALINRLASEETSGWVDLSRLGSALRTENPDLASLFGTGSLRKRLRELALTDERVSGTQVSIAPRSGACEQKRA